MVSSNNLWHTTVCFKSEPQEGMVELCISGFEDDALSVFVHKKTGAGEDLTHWELELATIGKPDSDKIKDRLAVLEVMSSHAGLFDFKTLVSKPVVDRDWLVHVHQSFPPIKTDRFFIYGSHYTGEMPDGLIPLRIDAATAFGSGEHETTAGCVQALETLQKDGHIFKNILDIGCGSGILGIAALKFWPQAKLTSVDIDPESVIVTKRHAEFNNVPLQSTSGDGYDTPLAQTNAPYDLVLSNILSGPLIVMAPKLASVMDRGGFVVLAGLLTRQEEEVKAAHAKEGIKTTASFTKGGWPTLLCQKN